MDKFNKYLYQVSSSVSQTVSQLSGVLPGNPVTREYESSAHIASAGPGLLWKIYKGTKRSTKQDASIFVFEKRQLEKFNKNDRELVLESLKHGVQQLTKIRHPQVLTVQHPLEESRDSIAFATEPVFASLANILGETTNMPQPANMSDYKFFDIEIKYGLLQISEGLQFLHNDVKLLHKNMTPESIVINASGVWKLFGLDFCVHNINPPNQATNFPFEDYSPTVPIVCQPSLNYLAPECVLRQSHSTASDMFSLGMLVYALHSPGKQCLSPVRDLQQFKLRAQQLKILSTAKLQAIPEELREFVKLLLNVTPEIRPDAHQFIKIPYFDDVGVKTLTYLDSLLQWDNLQKSQFYKGLPDALSQLPHRVKLQRVLACLVRDLGQPTMVPFILPSIFDIAKSCSKEEYTEHVLPHLKPLMKLIDPIQILLIMLQQMQLLLKLTPAEDVQQHVLPMLYRGLDSDSPQIHELCLSVLPTFAGLLDHANVKNSLLPRIKKLCLSTSTLSVRVNCLLCVGKLLEHLDKWLVVDEILPFLPQIPSREPAVLMGILGIYKIAMNHKKLGISKEILATRILPFLIPLCIENGLSLAQFGAITSLVKEMFQAVESEHRTKLQQLNSVKDEQKLLKSSMASVSIAKPVELDEAFSDLDLRNGSESATEPKLSMEQKRAMTRQQESVKLMGNQGAIEPQRITSPPRSQPKDLTASLLSDFAGSFQPNNNSMSPAFSQTTGGNINSSPYLGMASFNTSFNGNPAPLSPWGGTQNTLAKPQNHQDWSALDNLLPSKGNSTKSPMNQMKGSSHVPLMPQPSPASSSNNNQLSKSDLLDFLS
ncbi:SCY1-like protein 2 [Dendroctonus ponderosae]|uniref:SCY1-like protein 2 n=1 Tax=Dendroctonus ponderosae TaxID=77166 RepID=UPI002035EFBF|nr:SCY1-like protein 2 [Dendroctonus ponderosae]